MYLLNKVVDVMWSLSQITLPCILIIVIEIKFIHFHSYAMFLMKFIGIWNNYKEIIIVIGSL